MNVESCALKLRAISILSDLALPSLFSADKYYALAEYLGYGSQLAFPDGLNILGDTIHSLKPTNDRLLAYILPWVMYDELVAPGLAKSILEEDEGNESLIHNYWMVWCNQSYWRFEKRIEGQTAEFHTHEESGERRPNYNLFTLVRPGDKILAAISEGPNMPVKEFAAIFTVTKGVNTDRERGEQITMEITSVFEPFVQWEDSRQKCLNKQECH